MCFIFCFIFQHFNLFAQVSNNSIHQSSFLILDADPVQSTTDRSTVEWACINKKLTEKCLIYHNDQWFTFSSPIGGQLFLNVSNQECRKKFGVQVLVIEGNPCEASTYKLLHCESFTDQNDTFITIDSVEANKPYLINIDGFLGDICSFDIQLATKPKGYPLKQKSLGTLQLQSKIDQNIVTLNWRVDGELREELELFEVHRQLSTAFKSQLLKEVSLQFNAQGKSLDNYQYTDTLKDKGTYVYDIIGISKGGKRRLLDRKRIGYWPAGVYRSSPRLFASVPLNFKKKSDVDLLIMNELSGEILFNRTCVECSDQELSIDVTNEVLRGIQRFRIEVYHLRSKSQAAYNYRVSQDGMLLERID
ncbi:hypothetical protein [Chryseotalea sanaruensis]|uniref:hypothetical protein n=1 Tax=Chryseotalea sanaruensis TaxID=2482724 RepID=UPI0011D0E88A|nr:hypothetical protein [Chryseotalea sanaruensis]